MFSTPRRRQISRSDSCGAAQVPAPHPVALAATPRRLSAADGSGIPSNESNAYNRRGMRLYFFMTAARVAEAPPAATPHSTKFPGRFFAQARLASLYNEKSRARLNIV